jgi:hypothetical protein
MTLQERSSQRVNASQFIQSQGSLLTCCASGPASINPLDVYQSADASIIYAAPHSRWFVTFSNLFGNCACPNALAGLPYT